MPAGPGAVRERHSLCVIECKQPDMGKEPLPQAISQQIRNQGEDYIPKLFVFAQLLLGVAANDAAYGDDGDGGQVLGEVARTGRRQAGGHHGRKWRRWSTGP